MIETPCLVALGPLPAPWLATLAKKLDAQAGLLPLDLEFARNPNRGQYYSTDLLAHIPDGVLAVTEADLYIPILEFVFGEAVLGGHRAIVSLHRLHQEFYGLPPDPKLLLDRALTEARHEWGHACGVRHCPRYDCSMSASHSIELLDLKRNGYCKECARRLRVRAPRFSLVG